MYDLNRYPPGDHVIMNHSSSLSSDDRPVVNCNADLVGLDLLADSVAGRGEDVGKGDAEGAAVTLVSGGF
jgi:hypothetical protein